MTFCRDGPGWTPGRADSASFVEEIKAIGEAMGINLFGGLER
jgi:hypothetical protein